MPIRDWNMKKELIRLVHGYERLNEIVYIYYDKVLKEEAEKDENKDKDVLENLIDLWRRWGYATGPNPGGKHDRIFPWIEGQLGFDLTVPGQRLKLDSIGQLFDRLSEPQRILLFRALEEDQVKNEEYAAFLASRLPQATTSVPGPQAPLLVPPVTTDSRPMLPNALPIQPRLANSSEFFNVAMSYQGALRTARKGYDSGYIDQSFYYQTPDSATRWFAITDSPDYHLFDACTVSLTALVISDEWKSYIGAPAFCRVVMLAGGGAPIKDLILLRSMQSHARFRKDPDWKIRHALTDISVPMLSASRRGLNRKFKDDANYGHPDSRVEVEGIELDMMDLSAMERTERHLRDGNDNIAWFLTGGTIGNLDEAAFFASVASVAKANDWLVVGTPCFEKEPTDDDLNEMENEYRQKALLSFVRGPLRSLWDEFQLPGRAKDAVDEMKIKAVHGEQNVFCKVPNTITITAKVALPGRGDILLFKSSRYRKQAFTEFAQPFGWHHVQNFSSLKGDFNQIVFKFGK